MAVKFCKSIFRYSLWPSLFLHLCVWGHHLRGINYVAVVVLDLAVVVAVVPKVFRRPMSKRSEISLKICFQSKQRKSKNEKSFWIWNSSKIDLNSHQVSYFCIFPTDANHSSFLWPATTNIFSTNSTCLSPFLQTSPFLLTSLTSHPSHLYSVHPLKAI